MSKQNLRARAIKEAGILATAALTLGCLTVAASGQETPYYEGKTITLLVPFSPGGGTDTTSRLLAPLLSEFIEGNPTVIVENRGGGGSITGTNYFANEAPHDGTVVLMSSGSTHSAFALGDTAIDFDFADFTPVFGLPFGGVLYVRAETGIEEPQDILEPTDVPLVFGGENPSGGDLRRLLALDLLGVDYKAIFGYEGAGDSTLAFQRGEVNIASSSLLPYQNQVIPLVEDGTVVPIMSTGLVEDGKLVRVPQLPDLQTPAELYEAATGEEASGPNWDALVMLTATGDSISKALWFHNDAPVEAVAAFEAGLDAMFADPDTRAALEEELGGNEPMFGQQLRTAIQSFTRPDPDAKKWLQDYLVERWDYEPFN